MTLLQTSFQSELCTQSYGAPKSRESQLWQFWDSHLGVSRQKVIWMWASWRDTEYTIRGKVVASPKFGPRWVLWVQICSWLVLAPKVFQLCTNHLVFSFVQVRVNNWCLSLFLVPSQSSSMPFYPQSAVNQGTCYNSLLFHYFQFTLLTFESIKELGSLSIPRLGCDDKKILHLIICTITNFLLEQCLGLFIYMAM